MCSSAWLTDTQFLLHEDRNLQFSVLVSKIPDVCPCFTLYLTPAKKKAFSLVVIWLNVNVKCFLHAKLKFLKSHSIKSISDLQDICAGACHRASVGI